MLSLTVNANLTAPVASQGFSWNNHIGLEEHENRLCAICSAPLDSAEVSSSPLLHVLTCAVHSPFFGTGT